MEQSGLGARNTYSIIYSCKIGDCLCHLNDTVESYLGHVIRIVFYARLNSD
jgi:hypothetical protein